MKGQRNKDMANISIPNIYTSYKLLGGVAVISHMIYRRAAFVLLI